MPIEEVARCQQFR